MSDALDVFPAVADVFDPGLYNDRELEMIVKMDLGKPPVVLKPELAGLGPDEVITLEPLIERIFDLSQLEEHRGQAWAGVDAVKESAKIMQEYREQYQANKSASGVGFHPSMHTFDSRGRSRPGGVGSDNGRVRTYTDENGKRIPFSVMLTASGGPAEWAFSRATISGSWGNLSTQQVDHVLDLIRRENETQITIECPICGHSESYDRDSKTSEDDANHLMAKHLQKPKSELEAHQLLHMELYT